MLPEAKIEHRIIGRLRLRLPSMRGDTEYFTELREALSDLPSTGVVTITPATGSVLFEDTSLGTASLRRIAREHGWFEMLPEMGSPGPREAAVQPAPLPGVLDSRELRVPLILILLALALVQAARGQLMVPALGLLWFAYELSRREVEPVGKTQAYWSETDHSIH